MPRKPRLHCTARALVLAVTLAVTVIAGAGGTVAAAQDGPAELVAETPYPLRGEPVEIRLAAPGGTPLPGVTISARYRPNSETTHTESLGVTGPDGSLSWTPADAGVVTLQAAGEGGAPPIAQHQVAVRFGAFPAVGLLVMLGAATLLFGGAAFGFRLLLRPPAHAPAVEPPST